MHNYADLTVCVQQYPASHKEVLLIDYSDSDSFGHDSLIKVKFLAKMCISNTLSVIGCNISNILCTYKISIFYIMYGNNVCVSLKVAPMPATTCGLNGSLLGLINKEFM